MTKRAFSLIELSISLVIISLIIAAVMAVNNLNQQAKLQSIVTEMNNYRVAANKFKEIYFKYPGDLDVASNFWSSGCADVGYSCNGNGNGYVENIADINVSDDDEEIVKAWKHLSLAELVDQQFEIYSGMSFDYHFRPNLQMPVSKFSNVEGVYFFNGGASFIKVTLGDTAKSTPFSSPARNAIYLSGIFRVDTNNRYSFDAGILTALEAFALDVKLDDGHYDASDNAVGNITGDFRAFDSNQPFIEGNFSDPEIGNVQCADATAGTYLIEKTFLHGSRPKCNIGWGL
jgi:prepilin-type N-terminal cleavage/methylation domain-containing protein